jgi:hypothetical protein
LLDQGIGVQGAIGDPVVAPGEIPVTQQEMDDFNAIPVTQPMTGGITGDPIEVEDLINYQDPSSSDESGLDMSGTIGGAPVVGDFNEPTTTQGSLSQVQVPGLDYSQADIDAERLGSYTPSFEPEQQGLIDQAFSKVGSTAENIMDDLSKIPGAVVDFTNQTVDILGQKINVGKTLLSAGINKIVGGPISLVFDALGGLPQDSLENSTKRSIAAQLTANNTYGYNMGNDSIGQDPFGRNPVSAFGDYEQTLAEDAAYVGDSKFSNAKKDYAQDYFNAKSEVAGGVEQTSGISEEAGGTGIVSTGDVLGPGEFLPEGEDLVTAEELAEQQFQDEIDAGIAASDTDPADEGTTAPSSTPSAPPNNPYSGGEGGVQSGMNTPSAPADDYDFSDFDEGDDSRADPTGTGDFSDTVTGNDTSPGATGGEGGGGGGKGIVCTMMNDFYGFGSFRNKIWLEHSKSLAPEYQKGYHKIFLPLVAYARKNGVTNKIVRKTLEHIAVHRTIDIRQESRGKTHLLGRVYRKILEPICYLVGKYAK